ncbi:MAG: flagellar motor switch protein FliN [Oscillospiraceae bacterium]|nr:flagellar motor switch protein FliN [Oscillospiraceae bacterium]
MNTDRRILTDEELDAIGEIVNISMGAAATAVSTMLERQVVITTPQITQNELQAVDFSELEPAIVVKINYIEGLSGTNIIVIRRKDMGIILDLLMGNEFSNNDEYEFDEMSMSAACEVMNQMMGSSATAMSEMINRPINISTPQAMLIEDSIEAQKVFDNIDKTESVVKISFKMSIKETLDTTFSSVMPLALARAIVQSVNGELDEAEPAQAPAEVKNPKPDQSASLSQQMPPQQVPPQQVPPQQVPLQQMPSQQLPPQQVPPQQMPSQQVPPQQDFRMPPNDPQFNPSAFNQANPYPYQQTLQQPIDPAYQYQQYQQPYGQALARQYPQYGQQYQDQQQNTRYVMPSLNVKQPEYPDFSQRGIQPAPVFTSNMNMLLGVQLEVSVVIGRSKQKIKDVLDLGQGSVIELDRQTGSPAEIVVNGQLIAYGDVVVVGDNFGIRITEIVGTKELIDSIEKNNK